MASDAQRTIDLVFNGVDKTGAATQAALNNIGRFSGNIQQLTQPITDVTFGAVKLEAGILAAGVAMTTFAAHAAGDFDSAFREITTLIGKPVSELGTFREAILSYAATSTAPLEQITAAIYNAISAGVPLEESIRAVSTAEKLSVAGKADLNDTLRVLVASLNAYGRDMGSAAQYSDALFSTVRLGVTTLPELASYLSQVTGAAAAVGVPFETVLAALAALTATGTPTSQAVTQINAVLTALLKPGSEASKMADELGIQFNATAVKTKGLQAVLTEVATATGGSQEKMAKLFGSAESLKAVFPLVGSASEAFARNLREIGDGAGATEAAFTKMSGGLSLATQSAANSFRLMLVAIGTPLLDEFGGVAQAVGAIFSALGAAVKDGPLKSIVTYIEGLFGDLQTTLAAVAANLPAALAKADFGSFTAAIQTVVDAVRRLFSGVDLTTVDGLTRAVELAGAAFLGLSRYTAGVIDAFRPLFDWLVRMGSQIDGTNTGWLEFAGNIGGAVTQFNLVLGAIGGLVPWIETLVGLMIARNGLSLLGAVSSVAAALPGLVSALGVAGAAFAGAFAVEKIAQIVDGLLQLRQAHEQIADAQARAADQTERSIDTVARFNETTGLTVKTVDEAMAAVDAGAVVWSDAANGWVQVGQAMERTAQAADTTAKPIGAANQRIIDAANAAARAADATQGLASGQMAMASATTRIVPVIDEVTGRITGYTQQVVLMAKAGDGVGKSATDSANALRTNADVMEALGRKANLTTEELLKLAKQTKDAEIELAKLSSNERIKTIEAKVKFDIAELEAGTKRIESAFRSIDSTVSSTGDMLGSLFKLFADDDVSFRARSEIRTQIETENKARQDAFALQKKLTEAQIDQMKAATRRMETGDAVVKVTGDALKPHLEAMMWEVFKAVQIRVNQQGLSMLLGL